MAAFSVEPHSKSGDKSTSMENPQTNRTTNSQTKHRDLYSNGDADDADDVVYHLKQCYRRVPKSKSSSSEEEKQEHHHRRRRRQCNPSVIGGSTNSCHFRALSSNPLPTSNALPKHFSCCSLRLGIGGGLMVMPWRHCLIIASVLVLFHAMSTTLAAPQSCILCDKNDLQSKDPQTNYEEFLFEHQVTRQDAINALKQLNESFYDGLQADSSCNAVRCTEKVNKYCLGPQFINDHCYCEFGHSTGK
uniref:CCC domain-containing protein n=1 Tax=Musca domestica TaxID=7370 RepID=A0A1I8NKF9_MUSDO